MKAANQPPEHAVGVPYDRSGFEVHELGRDGWWRVLVRCRDTADEALAALEESIASTGALGGFVDVGRRGKLRLVQVTATCVVLDGNVKAGGAR